ncbi:MAG: prepilin-type N-terminal cleavage/methylation domain-containing protein [Phycisphaerales bacterium]
MTRAAPATTRRRAFTILELMVVVLLMSILAVAVLPALASLDEARIGAAADEIERTLVLARSMAMASGEPTGADFDLTKQTVSLVRITSVGGAPEPALDALSQPVSPLRVGVTFPHVEVLSLTNGNGSGGSGAIWFRFDGAPETRAADGSLVGAFTQDAVVTLTGPKTVVIRMGAGLVEQP